MADMTFQTNLIPNSTTLEYSLGSSTNKWNIYGICDGYLPLSGGTMTGAINWYTNSLSEFSSSPPYILGIEAFANGGTTKWKAASGVNVGSADQAKWLMNRGTNVTIADSSWSHGQTGAYGTNTSGGTVWKQKWTQSGLTYTPSGGSATTLTDSGDIVYWLSQSTTSNNLAVNMAIDGYIYSLNGFKGNLIGNADSATKWATARTLTIGSTGKSVNGTGNVSWSHAEIGATVSNTWTGGTTAGPTIKTTVNGVTGTAVAIPTATASASGVVTTGAQTWSGIKTFYAESTTATNTPAGFKFSVKDTTTGQTYSSAYLYAYQDHGASTYGVNFVLCGGGNTIIGSGESPGAVYSNAISGKTANANTGVGANACEFSQSGENLILTSDGTIYFLTNCNTVANRNLCYLNGSGHLYTTKTYGAVWNDYAEYRKNNEKEKEIQQPGRCVCEIGDGRLALTTERLMRGCEIISDTFGFAIGQDEEKGYSTPIASSGRVLAYPYESIEEFTKHIGYAVCSGPNGTVSIMTEEEEEKYPMRAIGTISEIPNYEEWGTGKVKVNGRVWIRIR